MKKRSELKIIAFVSVLFFGIYYLPVGKMRFDSSILESLYLAKWYAREHVVLCLLPAFFIAGAIGVFVSKASVMKYLGAHANKILAYGVASVSGAILAVCSCTVLPLFAGIYRMGAGLGPAAAFLYSGPAINVLAIILTARILGIELGIARALGAVIFSIIIGVAMQFIFRNEEDETNKQNMAAYDNDEVRPLWKVAVYFASMVGILVFANFGRPDESHSVWYAIHSSKWYITSVFSIIFGLILVLWFNVKLWKVAAAAVPPVIFAAIFPAHPIVSFSAGIIGLSIITMTDDGETNEWFMTSWGFAKQILPLLLIGVLVAGFLLGRPGNEGIIPSSWIHKAVGGNSLLSNLFASIAGAFMYFATLTEVPILQGLIENGMGKGPALALLLAGPALSLPNMLVIRSVMGTKKTVVYVLLVIIMATISGVIFGKIIG
jgi:hypothetical protein